MTISCSGELGAELGALVGLPCALSVGSDG